MESFISCFCKIGEKESHCVCVAVIVRYPLFPVPCLVAAESLEMIQVRST